LALAARAFLALVTLALAAFFLLADSSGLILTDPFKPFPAAETRTPFSSKAFKLRLMAGTLVTPLSARAAMIFLEEAPVRDLSTVLKTSSIWMLIGVVAFLAKALAFLAAGAFLATTGFLATLAAGTGATGAIGADSVIGAVSDMLKKNMFNPLVY